MGACPREAELPEESADHGGIHTPRRCWRRPPGTFEVEGEAEEVGSEKLWPVAREDRG